LFVIKVLLVGNIILLKHRAVLNASMFVLDYDKLWSFLKKQYWFICFFRWKICGADVQ